MQNRLFELDGTTSAQLDGPEACGFSTQAVDQEESLNRADESGDSFW
jgi:hypothetical protein